MTVTPEFPIKRRCDVTADEEWRTSPESAWHSQQSVAVYPGTTWVEVRLKQQPDPAGAHPYVGYDEQHWIATTVGEMRDRTDLDQWEIADTDGYWDSFGFPAPDDFPIIVRRKVDQ